MQKKAKLSVIIPIYNVEKYLSQCLDSVCNQTMQELEIICVNDGSTDSCSSILKKYVKLDKRIKVTTQKNGGLSAARNTGIKNSTCDYITFLDSDDWIAPDFYEILYNNAIKNNADISCGNVIFYKSNRDMWFDELDKRIFDETKTIYITPEEKKDICRSWACWNKIYKRDLVIKNKLLFYPGKLVEDFPFTFLVCALSKKIVVSPFALLYYRQNPNGIMSSKQQKCAFDVLDNCIQLRKDFYKHKKIKDNVVYQQILDNFLFDQCMDYSERGYTPQYMQKFKEIAQVLTHYDKRRGTILGKIIYKCLNNKTLNALFFMNVRHYKIDFLLFKKIPVFKIKWYGPKLYGVLFGFLPVYRFYKFK